jgi:hypothetical protein
LVSFKRWAVEWIGDDGEDWGNVIEAGSWDEAQAIADELGIELLGEIVD